MQALFSTLASQCAELRSEVGRLQAQIENQRAELQHYVARLPELQGELERARQDQLRLDWLNDHCVCLTPMYTTNTPMAWCATTVIGPRRNWFHDTVREVIDEAMMVTQ